MNKQELNKIFSNPILKQFYAEIGAKGGSSKSDKKLAAVRKNGLSPCKPGKFRGRPKKYMDDENPDAILKKIKDAEIKRLKKLE